MHFYHVQKLWVIYMYVALFYLIINLYISYYFPHFTYSWQNWDSQSIFLGHKIISEVGFRLTFACHLILNPLYLCYIMLPILREWGKLHFTFLAWYLKTQKLYFVDKNMNFISNQAEQKRKKLPILLGFFWEINETVS